MILHFFPFYMFYHCLCQNLTILDHSHFCPKRGVPQTSIVISCQFVNISKGNSTIDIAFFSLLYVLHYDRNVRNAEQDNRVADFDNFCDEQISPMCGHPFTRNVRNAEQDNRVADFDNFVTNRFPVCVATPFKLPCSRITVPFTIRRPESEVPLQPDSYE